MRSRRKRRTRPAACESSLASSRAAVRSNSIFHDMIAEQLVQGDRLAAAFSQIVQSVFGEINIFEIIEVTENRLAR